MCRNDTAENYNTYASNLLKPEEGEVRRLYFDEQNSFCENLRNLGHVLQNPEFLLDYVLVLFFGSLFSSFTFYHLKKFRLSMHNTRKGGVGFRLNRSNRAIGYATTSVMIGLLGTLLKASNTSEKPKVRVISKTAPLSTGVRNDKAKTTRKLFNAQNYELFNQTTIPSLGSNEMINSGKLRRVWESSTFPPIHNFYLMPSHGLWIRASLGREALGGGRARLKSLDKLNHNGVYNHRTIFESQEPNTSFFNRSTRSAQLLRPGLVLVSPAQVSRLLDSISRSRIESSSRNLRNGIVRLSVNSTTSQKKLNALDVFTKK
jgi:hypothetical protein